MLGRGSTVWDLQSMQNAFAVIFLWFLPPNTYILEPTAAEVVEYLSKTGSVEEIRVKQRLPLAFRRRIDHISKSMVFA
ncbi:hypothetical protein F2Q68_00024785 [Brassica cretica]|uniref:Uncharacterized protein n=1 Tax=Brassica cretica TaxID=69181 RepID=A0A8S9IFH3_BRACR|nr:hypothetical protein F2Q68_00024785 [Brassica cretica]